METTPGHSTKQLTNVHETTPMREQAKDEEIETFNVAYFNVVSTEKKLKKSPNIFKTKSKIGLYLKKDKLSRKKLTPLRSGRPVTHDINHSSRREKHHCSVENEGNDSISNLRLSNVFIRNETTNENMRKTFTIKSKSKERHRHIAFANDSMHTSGSLQDTPQSIGYVSAYNPPLKFTKPIDRNKLRQQIWRLPVDIQQKQSISNRPSGSK